MGAETFTEIEQYGEEKEEWFKTFLALPGGIPSHDTFSRVFSVSDRAGQTMIPTLTTKRFLKGMAGLRFARYGQPRKVGWFAEKKKWSGLQSIVRVDYEATFSDGKKLDGVRHFISSLPADALLLGKCIRNHWNNEYLLEVLGSSSK